MFEVMGRVRARLPDGGYKMQKTRIIRVFLENTQEASPGFEPGDNGFANRCLTAPDPKKTSISSVPPQSDVPPDVLDCTLTTSAANPDLARFISAWSTLPEPFRRAVLALVGSVPPPNIEVEKP
jgi:hypothetical protein